MTSLIELEQARRDVQAAKGMGAPTQLHPFAGSGLLAYQEVMGDHRDSCLAMDLAGSTHLPLRPSPPPQETLPSLGKPSA